MKKKISVLLIESDPADAARIKEALAKEETIQFEVTASDASDRSGSARSRATVTFRSGDADHGCSIVFWMSTLHLDR